MVHQGAVDAGCPLSELWLHQRPGRLQAQDDAVPLLGQGLRQEVQRPHRFRDAAPRTVYHDWLVGMFLVATNLKGVAIMKLHRDMAISLGSAWFLAQRLRRILAEDCQPFQGPVEVSETNFGGRRNNMPNARRKQWTGRGAVGKMAVVGAYDRRTNQVTARVVVSTDAATLQGFAGDNTDLSARGCHGEEHGCHWGPRPAVPHAGE